MRKIAAVIAVLLGLAGAWTRCYAQDDAPPSDVPLRSSAELDQLLGPIALYPDPLIGLMLAASTQPSQVVLADRYLTGGGDANAVDQQPWDQSVQGLAHYPQVLKWMDDNIDWTTELGQAFASQQSEVMDSVQRLRGQAQSLGNLQTTPQESVVDDDGSIDIDPVNADEMYVPDYQPSQIYSQPGIYCTFGLGLPIGGWLGFDWDWRNHHLIHWGANHPRPGNWWHLSPAQRHHDIPNRGFWRAPNGGGVVHGGDRGYEVRNSARPAVAPRVPVGHVETRAPVGRAPEIGGRAVESHVESRVEPRTPAPHIDVAPRQNFVQRSPEISRPVQHSAPAEGVFGGSQSAHEINQSSARGQMSRGGGGFSAPSRGGGGGGGNRR